MAQSLMKIVDHGHVFRKVMLDVREEDRKRLCDAIGKNVTLSTFGPCLDILCTLSHINFGRVLILLLLDQLRRTIPERVSVLMSGRPKAFLLASVPCVGMRTECEGM
jgi:hypothetical protein